MDETELIARPQHQLQERYHAQQEQTRQQMVQAMKDNGMDPAYIYAVEQTGVMPFQETMHLLTEVELERWHAAYDEYPGA